MQRRDFVKAMITAPVAAKAILGERSLGQQTTPPPSATPTAHAITEVQQAPAPTPWMRGLLDVKPLPVPALVPDAVAQTHANFFTDLQMATLKHFCEILVPAYNGNPSAVEAGTPQFLDFLIGASPAERQRVYQSGLDRLEAEARQHFNISFAETNAEQADQLIRPWLRTWMSDNLPTEPYAHFINVAHSDIREATTNSQAWSDAARSAGKPAPNMGLYWYPIDPDLRRDSFTSVGHGTPIRKPS
jgi:hypothetical protein